MSRLAKKAAEDRLSNFDDISGVVSKGKAIGQVLKISPMDVAFGGIKLVEVFMNQFKEGKKNAKLAGQLLAYTLVIRMPFLTQSVSLIGFSLGTQVIKSCLKTLHQLGANDLIHNVTLMGGAIDRLDRAKSKELWATILSSVISGEVKNVFTKKDYILLMYSICETDQSAGRNKLFTTAFLGNRRTNLLAEEGNND